MVAVRSLIPALAGAFMFAAQLGAQGVGNIRGTVIDSASRQALTNVSVTVEGTQHRTITRGDGSFDLGGVPEGAHTVRVRRIGYATLVRPVTVTAGSTATVELAVTPQAAILGEMVVTGYGSQRREAITGSVSTIDASVANVGVVANVTQMMEGRISGVQIIQNGGEPGAGSQIRVRGGTSLSGGNDPLYVIDGVAIENTQTEPNGIDIGSSLPRNPLNTLNPSDIESITVLKDASATAIYGARAANGVILIETKKGSAGSVAMEYDGYVAMASPYKSLDVLSGSEYAAFITQQVALGPVVGLAASRGAACTAAVITGCLGGANTNWEKEVTRSAVTHNQNVAFTGGGRDTRYRASVNYMNEQGVTLNNGFQRLQGRLNGTHQTLNGRLRVGLNLTASQVNNKYIPFENTGGFEGGVFANMVNFNPTHPVKVLDPATGQMVFYETGTGRQSVRNPVALTEQIDDVAKTTRTLASGTASLDLLPHLTTQMNVGTDRSSSNRQIYFPANSPVGAQWNGRANQEDRELQSVTLQNLLTYANQFSDNEVEVIGGYEYNDYNQHGFGVDVQNFLTDAFTFDNLAGGAIYAPFSWATESKLVSFFSRATWGFRDKYNLTGVVRKDGSSRFGVGNKWATFPAISASWRISNEDFMRGRSLTDLRLRVSYGLQGNPAVPPYASLILLEAQNGSKYPFGGVATTGVAPVRNGNPALKWEQTAQTSVGLDFGWKDNLLKGTVEYYTKDTKDLLNTVTVPQPAAVPTRLQNIGKIKNKGFEANLDAQMVRRQDLDWILGGVLSVERNTVVDLGGDAFIATASVSGQGQSGQNAQRIIPGYPLGTFYGPTFIRVNATGQQVFKCAAASPGCLAGETIAPTGGDYGVIGNANPSFTLGVTNQVNWRSFDLSALVRANVGGDVFNNTALVYAAKSNALQDKNFLKSALSDQVGIHEPQIYSSRYIEKATFVRLSNITVGYTLPTRLLSQAKQGRLYVSGDNLLLLTKYTGYDPEVHVDAGLASRGIDYLTYPRPRTFTTGVRLAF